MLDLVIIGAGPAGLTAALYAGRFRLKTAVIEKMAAGGQIILSEKIENFPGFPGGVHTQELIDNMKRQIEELGIAIELDEVTGVVPEANGIFSVTAKNGSFQARAVIIASGARPKSLGVEGEEKFTGRGVSYCGTCDGPLFKGKDVIVVGGGNSALEEAIFLTGYANKVTIVHRRQGFRGSKILEEKVRSNPKIELVLDTVVERIHGGMKVEGAALKNVKTGAATQLACHGVFIFVGTEPQTEFVKGVLKTDASGFIITAQDLKTSRDGIFACGDCLNKSLYQVVNACGEGAVAADSSHKYILNLTEKK